MKKTSCLLFLALTAMAFAMDFSQQETELKFITERTEVTVENARVTAVKNLASGVVFAGKKTPSPSKTAGIGTIANGRAKEMSRVHFPWGEPLLNQALPPIEKTQLYRYPDSRSHLEVTSDGKLVTAVWRGLTDSVDFFPDDSITATFSEDDDGALAIHAVGKTADKGIFGIQFPIENIDGKGKFLLATFGGMEYDACGASALLTFLDSGLIYEAKIMTYTLGNSSLGCWFEDQSFKPYFVMLSRGERSSSFGIEINSIMPYEQHDTITAPTLKIDTFDEAGWIAAATPYRTWYQRTFADDIRRRDSIEWANDIYAISDLDIPDDAALEQMAKIVPPENTLLHCWNARKPNFDTELPDYEPRDEYIANVKRAHAKGFKVMCYVCSLCANFNSRVWKRDKLAEFVLTRKNNISNYNGNKNVFDENLMGTLNAMDDSDQFAALKPGQLIYTDPLSAGWREYLTASVQEFNRLAGTDANYEDTLGCTADNGNGVVDGFAGAQGNMLLARNLAEKMPETPMASEYGPESIAFAVKWPLNYTTVWGSKSFREYRMHRQSPLCAYLFGYRPWIPLLRLGDDFHRHVAAACSDALGGLGFFEPAADINVTEGFNEHLNLRAKIFADNKLQPYFPARKYPDGIRAMYQSHDGRIFSYYDDGGAQAMLDDGGNALYARVNGRNSVELKDVTLPNWPAIDGELLTGLNPQCSYALFPAEGSEKAEVNLGCLPEGVVVKYYYTANNYAYIELDGKNVVSLQPSIPERFTEIYVNDELVSGREITGTLPMRIFISDGTAVPPDHIRLVTQASGLALGKPREMPTLRRSYNNATLYYLYGYNDVILDCVIDVKSKEDTVVFYHKNEQPRYGNGHIVTALVNGKPIKSFDAFSEKDGHDMQLRRWAVPIGEFAGRRVLFSIRVDNKADNNADMPFVSCPEVIQTDLTAFQETIIAL